MPDESRAQRVRAKPRTERSGVFRYTPHAFLKAERAGVFGDSKVELVEGTPFVMGTNPPHVYVVMRLAKLLRGLFPDDHWTIAEEKMVEIGSSCPIPDLLVLSGPMESYQARQINQSDIHLLVEVCDSSWARDLKRKLPIYARAGIPECWFVRLRTRSVHRVTAPKESAYAQERIFQETERIPVRDTELAVSEFLPRTA